MPKSFQIRLPPEEKNRLVTLIETNFYDASAATIRHRDRCRVWMQKWENRVNPGRTGDEGKPNHTVPLTQWQTFNKLARDMQSLLGDDAEITGRAVGPSDAAKVRKVGRFMTSLVFDQMEITNPLIIFEFRRILFGHAVAYRPWWKRQFDMLEKGKVKRVCDYEGPGFFPLEPDDFVTPAERGVTDLQNFSFVGHRRRVTVDDLQHGDGTEYQGTSDLEFVRKAIDYAKTNGTHSDWDTLNQNQVREERERSEGIDYDNPSQGSRGLWIWDWYGSWRPLKKVKRSAENSDAAMDDLERRLPFEADWKISFLPGMREIVGCQDLLDLYPKMRRRRPFVESTLLKDGTYRPKGFGALLEDLEDDATANSRLFAAAGELSVWPIIFFEPGSGFQPKPFQIEPGMAIPSSNAAGVKVVTINPNLEFGTVRMQEVITNSERVTGITDQSMGRALSQPNAPRTATGQMALIEQGNVRAWLDATCLREDMERIIGDFWEMESDLAVKNGPGQFFRVTEEQADGLFDVAKGGAYMTPKELGGRMDFKLKFATSVYAREAQKQQILAFATVALQNPLIAMNMNATWHILNRLAKAFGIEDFAALVPEPPEPDTPKTPDQEWTEMLEGTEVEVNPQDNDNLHIAQHAKQIDQERQEDPDDRDDQAIALGIRHLMKHKEQQRTKMLMQAQMAQLVKGLQEDPNNPVSQGIQGAVQQLQQPQQPGQPPPPGAPQLPQMGQPPGMPPQQPTPMGNMPSGPPQPPMGPPMGTQ